MLRRSCTRRQIQQLVQRSADKKHILHNQRKDRLIFVEEKELLEHSSYPAEFPSTYVPVPDPEVPDTKGRRILGALYRQFREFYNGHRNIVFFNKTNPEDKFGSGVWIAPSACVVGDVYLNDGVSVWYGVVIRGDKASVTIGGNTNIQDGTVITVDDKTLPDGKVTSVKIGDYCTIGHAVRLHGCTIGNKCTIGIGATVLEGAVVEDGAIVAAGSVVPAGTRIPAGEVWGGSPLRFLRKTEYAELKYAEPNCEKYVNLATDHSLEFTSTGLAYKEVDKLVEQIESKSPVTDERPVHMNVWGDMGKQGAISNFKKGERDYTKI